MRSKASKQYAIELSKSKTCRWSNSWPVCLP